MVRLESLTRRFGETTAVADLSLTVEPGELLTLLGPSGCGKTTTLRMIAGFETPSAGRVLLQGRDITAEPPRRRGIGMVFQNYALFPHLDVFENVAFGLRSRGTPPRDLRERTERALELVDLRGYGERRVQALSGGQQQRVALARALAPEPPVLLLDEPLSNLDPTLRERTRTELRSLLKRLGITAIFVTHDQDEAFALADRVALLEAGRLQQIGTPERLYHEPANAFVASFLGRANFLPGTVVALEDDGGTAACDVGEGIVWNVPAGGVRVGQRVRVMARPEALVIGSAGGAGGGVAGEVLDRRFAGALTQYRVATAGGEVLVFTDGAAARVGERVRLRPKGAGAGLRAFAAEGAAEGVAEGAEEGAAEDAAAPRGAGGGAGG